MANLPEGLAQFEYQKVQLMGSLGAVAETMRNCAAIAEQFAQMIPHLPLAGAGIPGHPNGQYVSIAVPQPVTGKRKLRDEVEGRKKKIPKDPNAPKRPASSYLLFQNEVRQELKAKHPNLPNNELLGIISKLWAEMPKEQKDQYEQRQKQAKNEWLKSKAAYEHRDDPAGEDGPVAAASLPPPKAVVAVAAAPVASSTGSSSDEESSEEEGSSSSSSSEEEQAPPPPPKKSKKEKESVEPAAKGTAAPVKEKKSKKKA